MNPYISRLINIISLACIILSLWGVMGVIETKLNDDEFIGMTTLVLIPLVLNYLVSGKIKFFTRSV